MKKFLAAMMSAVLALSLAACGGATSSSTPASAPASQPASAPASQAASAPDSTAAVDYSAYTGATIDAIKAKGKLVLGTEAQYAPFEFLDASANFAGCDIWLAHQIADALGVELEVMDMAFDGIIPAVKSSQVDLGIAAFTVDEERAKEIDFSEVYQKDQQLLIVQKGNEDVYTSKEALKGKTLGAQRGTVQSKLIESALPDCTLFELDKWPALALEVAGGKIDGLVVDGAVGEGLVANNDGIVVANFEFSKEEANFGKAAVLKQGTDDLKELVNAVITQVVADGSFEAAYEEDVAQAKTLGI